MLLPIVEVKESQFTLAARAFDRYTVYSIRVSATNAAGVSAWSNPLPSVDALVGFPSAPSITGLTFVESVTQPGVTITFTPPANNGGRELYRCVYPTA